jgi:hypothetical protein
LWLRGKWWKERSMSIVSGNQPPKQRRRSGPSIGWIVPLLIFGPTLYNLARRSLAGRFTDQQLILLGGALAVLVAFIAIGRWLSNQRRSDGPALPPGYQPSPPKEPRSSLPRPASPSYTPQAPRFEPIVTGKVIIAGAVLALLMAGAGFLLLTMT